MGDPMSRSKEPLFTGGASLDAAWREAEAALPTGWGVGVHRSYFGEGYEAEGRYAGVWLLANGSLPSVTAEGDTPAAALRALAANLRG